MTSASSGGQELDSEMLLQAIRDYCRASGVAESTFGRLTVNDGKLVSRLRYGGRVTPETAERLLAFMRMPPPKRGLAKSRRTAARQTPEEERPADPVLTPGLPPAPIDVPAGPPTATAHPEHNFRFYDNRQKYLMFVNTCSEKRMIAERIARELASIHPRPPAVRVFDAGVGDGTILTRVLRAMHQRFESLPFYVVGKEISLEDVRLALEKAPDRFNEHPATVLILTNLYYSEAPSLLPKSPAMAARVVWHEVGLSGRSAAEYEHQINDLEPFLARHWRASVSKTTGNPVYEQPVVLVLYLESQRFLLDQVIPRRGAITADYDLVIASQPYRARATAAFKAEKVIAPLVRALAPGGRLLGIHSSGDDPALEIVQAVWPGERPFTNNRHDILRETKTALGSKARHYTFNAYSDDKSKFRYQMYTLPGEIDTGASSIGTSTVLAAWNNATYVAQVEDERLAQAMSSGEYLTRTKDVLRKHNGLWFNDESYVISRKRDI
ncbi:MAG: hypothetical protein AB7I79_15110 [Rhizobiaceae bacterium]